MCGIHRCSTSHAISFQSITWTPLPQSTMVARVEAVPSEIEAVGFGSAQVFLVGLAQGFLGPPSGDPGSLPASRAPTARCSCAGRCWTRCAWCTPTWSPPWGCCPGQAVSGSHRGIRAQWQVSAFDNHNLDGLAHSMSSGVRGSHIQQEQGSYGRR